MIEPERIKHLKSNGESKGQFVIYWMQQSQRIHYNQAFEYAIQKANDFDLSLIVYFGITDNFPEANLRHYVFMLEGLLEIGKKLQDKKILFVLKRNHPLDGIIALSDEAKLIVFDRGYTRIQKEWRDKAVQHIDCSVVQVESDVIVPIETTSQKEEYGAYSIRPKIHRYKDTFLKPLPSLNPKKSSLSYNFETLTSSPIKNIIQNLHCDKSISPSPFFHGGFKNAYKHMVTFFKSKLNFFENQRNDPSKKVCSNLSPYLHFGQLSPIYIALQALKNENRLVQGFLEELIIRRELSMNFVHYNNMYDSPSCLPSWAYETLMEHTKDNREYQYTVDEFEKAITHDPYWNAAQKELMITGKMHGYMRMYWGKKIIEWSETPDTAYKMALYLNNKYGLDGRDPNGYAGVAWCFGKHDRAWKERKIFGKIRYMNAKGLERKGDIKSYVNYVNELEENIF